MIWTVKTGEYYLYDTRLSASDRRYLIFDPTLTMELNKAATFTFTILPNHPSYREVDRLTTPITVYRDDELMFSGRLLDDTLGWNNERKMVCESDLAFLNDSFQRPYSFPLDDEHTTPADFFTFLIQNHNAIVGADRRFNIGTITVTDANNYIARSDTEYSSTWSLLNDLLSSMGGYLNVRYSSGIRFIDWLTEPLYAAGQSIELGRNILDLETSRKGSDIITALVPLGAVLEEEAPETEDGGAETTEDAEEATSGRLTIENLPDGPVDADIVKKDEYVYSQSGVARYGWIFGRNTWDDVTVDTNLLRKGAAYLSDKILIPSTVTIKAADLAGAGYDAGAFNLGDTVTVTDDLHSEAHGLASSYVIEKLTLKPFSPGENTITVGSTTKSFTETNRQRQEAIKNDVAVSTKTKAYVNTKVREVVSEVSSTIEQSEEKIMSEVEKTYMTKDDGETISKAVTKVEQTAEGLATEVSKKANASDVPSYNLLGFPYAAKNAGDSVTYDGVTVTYNDDGSITFDGTATATTIFALINSTNEMELPDGTYTFGFHQETTGKLRYQLYRCELPSDTTQIASGYVASDSTFNWSNAVEYDDEGIPYLHNTYVLTCNLTIRKGEVYDNFTIRPTLEYGNSIHAWQPVALSTQSKIVQESDRISVEVSKKASLTDIIADNLLGLPYGTRAAGSAFTAAGVTVKFNYDGSITFNGTSTGNTGFYLVNSTQEMELPDGDYILGFNQETTGLLTYSFYRYIPDSKASSMLGSKDVSVNSPFTWSYASLGQYFTLALTIASGKTFNNFTIKPQLESGSILHAWQPVALSSRSLIEQTANSIKLEVDNKVGNDEIIAKINLSAESQSGILISADKINMEGVTTFIAGKGFVTDDDLGDYLTDDDVGPSGTTVINGGRIKGGTLTLGGSGNGNGVLSVLNASSAQIVKADKDGLAVKASSTTSGYIELDYGAVAAAIIQAASYGYTNTKYNIYRGNYNVGKLTSAAGGLVLEARKSNGTPRATLFLYGGDDDKSVTKDSSEAAHFLGGALYSDSFITPQMRMYLSGGSGSGTFTDITNKTGTDPRYGTVCGVVDIDDGLEVYGRITCYALNVTGGSGYKNTVVRTEHFGDLSLSAMESTYPVFSDLGSGTIDETGVCYIVFDPDFAETIEILPEYQVFVSKTGGGGYSRIEKHADGFAVYGDAGFTFDWILYARQKGFQADRLPPGVYIEEDQATKPRDALGQKITEPIVTKEMMSQYEVDYDRIAEDAMAETVVDYDALAEQYLEDYYAHEYYEYVYKSEKEIENYAY